MAEIKNRNRSQLQRGLVLLASQSNIFQKKFFLIPAGFFSVEETIM